MRRLSASTAIFQKNFLKKVTKTQQQQQEKQQHVMLCYVIRNNLDKKWLVT